EQAAVRQSPDAEAGCIDVRLRREPLPCRKHVSILRVATAAGLRRLTERASVTNTAAVVYGHHDVALVREPLIHAVEHVVEAQIVPAEQHLPRRTAVHEDQRRALLTGLDVRRREELV